MYLFFYFVNNKNMRKKVISLFKKYNKLNKHYNLSNLAAANAFYMILLIIPLNNIGFEFYNLRIINFLDIYKWGILFFINIVFVGTKYLRILKETNNKILNIYEKTTLKKYVKSLFLVILLILIVTTLIIISFGLIGLWNSWIKTKNYLVIKIMEIIITFLIITLVIMFIFKYVTNNLKYNIRLFKISCTISLMWLILSTIYQNIVHIFNNYNIDEQYQILLKIYFIYCLNYLIIVVLVYNYWQNTNVLSIEKNEII